MVKTYVLDTNVLLIDANSIFAFDDNNVIIPLVVLEELDRHKTKLDDIGRNARQVCRFLDDLRNSAGSLLTGVRLLSGGLLKIESTKAQYSELLPSDLQREKVDNQIIAFMLYLKCLGQQTILVTRDINVRVKCDALGIECQDYLKVRIKEDSTKFYKGVSVINVDETLIDQLYDENILILPSTIYENKNFYNNEIIVLKYVNDQGKTVKSALTKIKDANKHEVVMLNNRETIFGLKPKNKEQTFALDLLLDDKIKLVTLASTAGCGKTLLSLAAGLEQLKSVGNPNFAKYEKLIVSRPIQPLGNDVGFLPGTLEEKMEPWIAPIKDNLEFLFGNKRNFKQNLRSLKEKGLIEVEAITYIRGRSISNAYIILDECQNISMHELKTVLTRIGEGSKIVLCGDLDQIDNPHVDVYTSGLTYAIEKFKESEIAAHITLIKGERSALSSLAAKIL